jgi:hypothetical protein
MEVYSSILILFTIKINGYSTTLILTSPKSKLEWEGSKYNTKV